MILNDVVETLMIEEMRKKWRRKKKKKNQEVKPYGMSHKDVLQ